MVEPDVVRHPQDDVLALGMREDSAAPGWRSLRPMSFRSLNVSWTMQLPCQSTISRPSFLFRKPPRFLSGAKRTVLSAGICATIFSAFDDVTM